MQLQRIKLAGFKSFADPVTIDVPKALTGVVGPNGSGKSNVIDAMRWVIGESSAKSLRGESLDDVIFNGSSQRKPAARASVELLFDNSLNRASGQWSKYVEISVRRTVTRDGISEYFINGTRARRRDVRELFLGTGFGPRSYSIIEQGMISRIVEGKPEDLSSFIEEASGVSKFREKRHETTLKIKRVEENLERLGDLRSELAIRLRQLKYQADEANRYRKLKVKAHNFRVSMLAFEWGNLHKQTSQLESGVQELEIELEKRTTSVRTAEADLESSRKRQIELQTRLNDLQMEQYRLNADLSNLEEKIKDSAEKKSALRTDIALKNDEIREIEKSIVSVTSKGKVARSELQRFEGLLTETDSLLQEKNEQLEQAERQLENIQKKLEQLSTKVIDAVRRRESTAATLEELDRKFKLNAGEIKTLNEEMEQLESQVQSDQLDSTEIEVSELSKTSEQIQSEINLLETVVLKQRELRECLLDELESESERLQETKVKLGTLKRSLEATQSDHNESIIKWMADKGLSEANFLHSQIRVENDWERAVDRVLGEKLSAVKVNDLSRTVLEVNDQKFNNSAYFVEGDSEQSSPYPAQALASFVASEGQVAEKLLTGVYVADSLEDALERRADLDTSECLVTADGAMLGRYWYSPAVAEEVPSGLLESAKLMRKLHNQVLQDEEQQSLRKIKIAETKTQIDASDARLAGFREKLSIAMRKLGIANAKLNEFQSRKALDNSKLEQIRQRIRQLQDSQVEIKQEQMVLRDGLESENRKYAQLEQEKYEMHSEAKLRNSDLKELQNSVNEIVLKRHGLELEQHKCKSDIDSSGKLLEDLAQRKAKLRDSEAYLKAKLDEDSDPTLSLKEQLSKLVDKIKRCDGKLAEVRSSFDEAEGVYRKLDKQRVSYQLSVEEVNSKLQNRRLELGRSSVQTDEIRRKVDELDANVEGEWEKIPDEFDYDITSDKLARTVARIENAGPVNLIAADQHAKESERSKYLESQHDDLQRALDTLHETIIKIDRESRERFIETFSIVNSEYQRLLPILFGGGNGHLELIGEYPENAGMRIFARPKGKRIHNIQSLSGGEKALTAVALILSFFQLNPAPVCLLDEIDAPLDDDNVYRLCNSLRDLAEGTQLILITHNKITMEYVDTLIGVTMPEPNVSRVIFVDIQEAQEYAA